MNDVDERIAEYRRCLRAEAELAESDVNELEDHLRELTHELRTAGMSAAEAVTEAAQRLGDPRQVAREHTHRRSPFGAPLSAGRAVSAALLLLLPFILWITSLDALPRWSVWAWFELGGFVIVAVALAKRVTWARAAVLGMALHNLTMLLLLPVPSPFELLMVVGLLAFVLPWRRKEMSPAALTLALQTWAYASISMSQSMFETLGTDGRSPASSTFAVLALLCAVAACLGTIMRARWSAIASAITAVVLFSSFGEIPALQLDTADSLHWQPYIFGAVASGAVAATIAAALSWRTTRSIVGTLRHVTR